ncbi:hypothetical protein EVG20_g2280 [Dentipellis fragilis]|uniref:FAD-binding PCMH-type domain-containing protein n=1 Tax=Dentipellis fragilis TaxID=205917 RepID=A0A4Y9ZAB1_9AGAM|nr:hypothetical protein EVG20_g2280 [Dentipellis fragilis]
MLFSFLVTSSLALAAKALQKCKCLPGDPCFPSAAKWNTLSSSLSQPLITNQTPLGSVCYRSSSNFNAGACSSVQKIEAGADFRVSVPNAVQWVNWEELPSATNNTILGCPFDPQGPNVTCHQGRVPSYVVNVTRIEDIVETIKFASAHNLHLVVKNTGHENLGRPFGVGSVELFTHNMQGSNFTDSFVPKGAPHGTPGAYAVTVEPGVQWGPLYELADAKNRTVVGGIGAGGTVGAGGGWPAGGGHSILSPFYGLGVDNILQFTVVLPSGSHVTTNKYENTDLFWALRGGGGPSFGVITSTTYRTHPNIPYTAAFYVATANSSDTFLALAELFNTHHNAIADSGWAGFWPFNNNTLYLTLLAQGSPPVNASSNATLESFYAASAAVPGVNVTLNLTVAYPTFFSWYHDNFLDSSLGFGYNYSVGDATGIRIAVSSWLVPRDLFDSHPADLAKAWQGIGNARPFMVGGGAVAATDPDSAAVTPAFRTMISDIGATGTWDENATPEEIQAVRQTVSDQIEPLRQLGPIPAGGQYINEPDYIEKNWQGAYWGDHYPRLLKIKKAIDPNDLFIVYKGVNSEAWDEQVVCKTV